MTVKIKKNADQRAADILAKLTSEKPSQRSAEVVGVDLDARTVELAFSSETEVPRWFGIEVLSHDVEACDLSRLNDGAAVLDGHDWTKQVGVVERAWIDPSDRRGRALVRYSRSAEGEAMLQDIADKIKRHVSVGYRVLAIRLTEEREGVDVYTVTRWQPYEISNVPIPADTSVGVARSADIPPEDRTSESDNTSHHDTTPPISNNRKPDNMKEKILRDASGNLVRAKVNDEGAIIEVIEMLERAGDAVTTATQTGENTERTRVRSIAEVAGNFANVEGVNDMVRTALADGTSVQDFQRSLLDKLNTRAATPLAEQARGADIGMSTNEVASFSLLRVARALMDPTDRRAQEDAAGEFEASRAAAEKGGKSGERFVIPTDVLRSSVYGAERAPLNSGTGGNAANGSTGGNLVATNLAAGSFIDILRNRAVIMQRGRVIGGLVGNIDIPKQLAAANGYWLGEDDDLTETGMELGQIPLSPKTVGAYSELTRRLLMQSSLDVEAMARADLAIALALTIDKAGFYGTGSDFQPKGIANYTGIAAKDFATAAKPTFEELVDLETQIATDNADVNGMVYAGNAGFRGHCKTTLKFAGVAGTIWEQGNTVNGYGTEITNQVAAGDVFFGNFADLLIAMWGGLELMVDPYSGSKKGRVRLTVFQDVDFALRRVESFGLGRAVP